MAEAERNSEQPEEPAIVGRLRLGQADFDAVWRKLPPVRFMRAVLMLQTLAAVLVGFSVMPDHYARTPLVWWPLVWSGLMLLAWFSVPKLWARQLMKDSYFEGDVTFEVNRRLLHVHGGPLNARVSLERPTRIIELPRYFLIFPKPLSAFLLPKHAFDEPALTALRQHLPR